MAAEIAAHGLDDNRGLLGIAPSAKIMPIADGATQVVDPAALRKAITWAVEHGATVLCVASGTGPSHGLEEAIETARKAGVVIVAGVGNRPESTSVAYPAAYPGVIAAAGVDRDGNHADFSVTGPQVVLSAPAVDIVSADGSGHYIKGSGTSDATAIIAGVVALVRAKYPALSAADIVHRLTSTATDRGPPGRDDQYGYGIVNPVAALTADVPSVEASPSASAASPPPVGDARPRRATTSLILPILAGLSVLVIFVLAGVLITRRRAGR
jgi:subtilisin family serine protease